MKNLLPDRTIQTGTAFGLRLVLWLVALFAIVETPLGRGELFGETPRISDGAKAAELPPRFATPAESKVQAVTVAAEREVVRSAIVEHPDLDVLLPGGKAALARGRAAAHSSTGVSTPRPIAFGYDAQAPPAA